MTASQSQGARVGKACPPFAFTSAEGQEFTSRALLGKKALAVVFTSGPQSPEMQQRMEALARRYPDDLALVLVGAGLAAAPPLIITHDKDGALARAFGADAPPVAYFMRRDGLVTRIAHAEDPLLTDPDAFERLALALIG